MGGELSPRKDPGALLRLRVPGDQCLDGTTAGSEGFFKSLYPPGGMVGVGKGKFPHGGKVRNPGSEPGLDSADQPAHDGNARSEN